jgi:uncharacterized protein YeaO (DUF488 family)
MSQPPEHVIPLIPTLTDVVDPSTLVAQTLPVDPVVQVVPSLSPDINANLLAEAQAQALNSFKERFQNEVTDLESKLRNELEDLVQQSVQNVLRSSEQAANSEEMPYPEPSPHELTFPKAEPSS